MRDETDALREHGTKRRSARADHRDNAATAPSLTDITTGAHSAHIPSLGLVACFSKR